MITYAVDSSGKTVKAHMENWYFAPENKRLEAINKVRLAVLPYLRPFGANDKTFSVAMQPYGYEDRLIWFTKIHAESDSNIVKSSQNALRNKNYVFESKAEEYLFNSVLSVTENGKTNWYLLYAESLCFTRNMYDKKIINAVFEDPVPYKEFITTYKEMRISKKEMILEERTDKMKYLSPMVDFEKPEKLIEIALTRTADKNLDAYFKESLKGFFQAVENRDKESNTKTMLLMYLTDNAANKRDAFTFYTDLRTWINEEYTGNIEDTSCIDNIIKLNNAKDEADIYVCKRSEYTDEYIFVVNGRVFDEAERLKEYVKSGKCFEKAPDWWSLILSTAYQN